MRFRTLCLVVPTFSLLGTPLAAQEWPTYLHDNARSGRSPAAIELPLVPRWTFTPHVPPDPAWTEPAKEAARVRFDDAFHVVVGDGRVYFGSSGDNKVYALDAATGEELWSFFTGGPVRLAPTFWQERLYFGSDDGFVYCVRASDGGLLWKKQVPYSDERVIGHGRIISLWPVRTSVLVADGVAYFGAGVFPAESIFICAADALSGEILWRNDAVGERGPEQQYDGISPQGYLLASKDTLYAPSGRSMPAAFSREDGRFLFYLRPGGKVGGNYALLTEEHVIAGVNDQKTYEQGSGKPSGGGYAWSPANRLIVTPEVSYSLTDHQILALDRRKHPAVAKVRDEVAGKRQELQTGLRDLYRQRYRLDKQDPGFAAKDADLGRQIEARTATLNALRDEQSVIEDGSYRWKLDTDCRDSMVLAGDVLFAGGAGRVIGVDVESGKWKWTGEVEGRAVGLAVADGRLYVSTTVGRIHCFEEGTPLHVDDRISPHLGRAPFAADEWTPVYEDAAERILAATGVRRGFCLVLGCGEGRLAFELARRSDLVIYGVDPDEEDVRRARRSLDEAGLYGSRVTVDLGSLADLPYPRYFANLIVSDDLLRTGRIEAAPDEMMRVLRPAGGIAFLGQPQAAATLATPLGLDLLTSWLDRAGAPVPAVEREHGLWAKVTRGPLPGAGSWTHMYADPANSANSRDQLVTTPLGVLWFGEPGPEHMVERHARAAAPVSLDGRLFVEGENIVMAYDAYNGLQLWEREIPGALRVRVDVDGSNMAVTRKGLFVATRDRALRLDPATGETLRAYTMPPNPDADRQRWGYLASEGDLLFGSAAKPLLEEYGARWQNVSEHPIDNRKAKGAFNASGQMWRYMQEWPDWGREDSWKGALTSRMITSSSLFALDVESGESRWRYEGRIPATTVSIADDTVFFTDCNVTEEEKKTAVAERRKAHGRLTDEPEEITDYKEYDVRHMVALHAKTGKRRWKRTIDFTGSGGNKLGTAFHDGMIFVFGHFSNHDGGPFKDGRLKWRRVSALSAADGYTLWSRELNYLRRPMFMGDRLIVEPRACDVRTGEYKTRTHPVTGESVFWEFKRGGHSCGVVTASASTFFFRSDSLNYYDIDADEGMLPIGGTRAGCWINMITAGGLALLPEASAGCTCSYPIRTTIVMAPKKEDRAWSIYATPGSLQPVKHWHINLGAPGDRKDSDGNVWFAYPRLDVGYGVKFALEEKLASGQGFFARSFEATPLRNTNTPWVYSSGVTGLESCVLPLQEKGAEPREYRVRLGFCEPLHESAGRRVFDVKLQGDVVLQGFDIARTAGGRHAVVVKEFTTEVADVLEVELVRRSPGDDTAGAPLLNSIEVLR